jgi:hypothetical protein
MAAQWVSEPVWAMELGALQGSADGLRAQWVSEPVWAMEPSMCL